MTAINKTVLVLGATGRQGGATTRHLLRRGWRIRALVRDPKKPAGQALLQAGVEVLQGEYDDRASLDAAMRGIYGVFSVLASVDEVRQAQQISGAARAASVQHFVYSSVQSAEALARAGGDSNKWEIEKYLQSLAMPVTILRPSFFMETLPVGPLYGVPRDVFSIGIKEDGMMGLIAVDDIGEFAALAFEHPGVYLGKTIEIAGDILTPPQIAAAISRVTGRSIRYGQVPIEILVQQNPEIARATEYLNATGYPVDVSALRKLHPGLMNFDIWLKVHGKAIFATTE